MTEQSSHNYIPLYRKYRPQTFNDLVGQDNLVKAFTNALNTGKIAHAYLFCGPRGTGKTSSARILAKSLNCKNGPTLTPCGECPSCLDIINGNMLDVIEMDAASNRSVEDAQNIIDKIHYAPVNGKYKIFIIDEVHMISTTAFNALLKTLEEPPENVVFILATTEPQKVLETIISRCQRFDFRRITVDDIVKRLEYISQKENIKINKDALLAIAKNSQGGMRDALALLDQISVLDVENEITPDEVYEMLGKINNETLFELAQYIIDKSVSKAIEKINQIYAKGNEPLQIIENLLQYFRNLSVVKTCQDSKTISDLTLLTQDNISAMQTQAQKISITEVSHITEKLSYYHREIKYTNNRYLWLELCFIELTSENITEGKDIKIMPPNPSSAKISIKPPEEKKSEKISKAEPEVGENEIIKEIEAENEVENTVSKEPLKETPKEQPLETIPEQKNTDSVDDWKKILELVESPPSRSFFTTFAKPAELSPQKVVISFKDETFANRAKEPQKADALKKACMRYYNVPSMELEIKKGDIFVNSSHKAKPEIKEENKEEATFSQIKNTPENYLSEGQSLSESVISDNTKPQAADKPKVTSTQISYEEGEEEYSVTQDFETSDKNLQNTKYEKYNDQVKMVKDMFEAKVFD